MTILNVDDDTEDALYFSQAIQRIDPEIECIVLNDAIEAHDLLADESTSRKIDIIFLDINMPKMNGFELLEAIKKNKRLKKTPVYMHTTSCTEREIAKTESLGAKCIQKQSDFKKTVHLLSEVLLLK